MAQRSSVGTTHTRPVLAVAPDPVRDLFHASRISTEIADERSELEGTVAMRIFDLLRVWHDPWWMTSHGLPKFTRHEWMIMQHIVFNGRSHRWTAVRGGQNTINRSLAHEIVADYHDVSKAVTRLRRVGLVEKGQSGLRESIVLTEHFHRMMFEARWRSELRNSNAELVAQIVLGADWRWLMSRVDDVFRITPQLSHTRVEDRRRALSEAMYRLLHD